MSRSLAASEREVIVTIPDDEQECYVFTDSTRRTRRLLLVAKQWGVTPQRHGEGYEFTLPIAALRFVGPMRLTAKERARREHLREVFRNGKVGAKGPSEIGSSSGPGPNTETADTSTAESPRVPPPESTNGS